MSCEESLKSGSTAGPRAAGVVGTTTTSTGECCWCKDFALEINTSNPPKYYELGTSATTKKEFLGSSVKYKLYCALATGIIRVEMRFAINRNGFEAAVVDGLWDKLEKHVGSYWNSKAKLVIEDPECGTKKYPIEFQVKKDAADFHRTFEVFSGHANARDLKIQITPDSTAWTMAHEFGHTFGLPDEYVSDVGITHAFYHSPDGSTEFAVERQPNGSPPGTGTIMTSVGTTKVIEQHFWCIAIEAQALLRRSLGRAGIKCGIEV